MGMGMGMNRTWTFLSWIICFTLILNCCHSQDLSVQVVSNSSFYGLLITYNVNSPGASLQLIPVGYYEALSEPLKATLKALPRLFTKQAVNDSMERGIDTITIPQYVSITPSQPFPLPICSPIQMFPCIDPDTQYHLRAFSLPNISQSSPLDVALPSIDCPVSNIRRLNSTTPYKLDFAWDPPTLLDELIGYKIFVKFTREGDSPFVANYIGNDLQAFLSTTPFAVSKFATNFTLSGCYVSSYGTLGCITPFTVYQIIITSIHRFCESSVSAYLTTPESVYTTTVTNITISNIETNAAYYVAKVPDLHYGDLNSLAIRMVTDRSNVTNSGRLFFSEQTRVGIGLFRPNPDLAGFPRNGFVAGNLGGLQPYTNYTIQIALGTNVGYGPFSDSVSFCTLQTVPGILDSPRILDTSRPGAVEVVWRAPNPLPGIITKYFIVLKRAKSGQLMNITQVNGNVTRTTFELPNLVLGDTLHVRAATAVGIGPLSQAAVDQRSETVSSDTVFIIVTAILVCVIGAFVIVALKYKQYKRERLANAAIAITHPAPDEWEIPPRQIILGRQIGEGQFGKVLAAEFVGTFKPPNEFPLVAHMRVAVKQCSKERNSPSDKRDFIREAHRMKKICKVCHPNVVQLLGVCLQAEPLAIVLEYMHDGNLREYLIDSRPEGNMEEVLTVTDRIKMMLDICSGMTFLSETLGFVHRDLAARNCLVMEEKEGIIVKIADFGLSKDIHYLEYYRKTGQALLPVRWIAPEALIEGIFNTQTDVFSFGIVCWEIWSWGQLPYADHNNQEVFKEVISGVRPAQPTGCPDAVYDIMLQCWGTTRPKFRSLQRQIKKLHDRAKSQSVKFPILESEVRGVQFQQDVSQSEADSEIQHEPTAPLIVASPTIVSPTESIV